MFLREKFSAQEPGLIVDITLLTKVPLVKAMVFPVVMYECESWTIKKAERRRIDAFELYAHGGLGQLVSGKKKPLIGFPAPSWVAYIRTSIPLLADPAFWDPVHAWVLLLGPRVPLGSWAHPASLLTPQREQDQKEHVTSIMTCSTSCTYLKPPNCALKKS